MPQITNFKSITPAPDVKVLACRQCSPDEEPVFFSVPVVGWGLVEREYKSSTEVEPELLVCLFNDGYESCGGRDMVWPIKDVDSENFSDYVVFRAHHASAELPGAEKDAMVAQIREARTKAQSR